MIHKSEKYLLFTSICISKILIFVFYLVTSLGKQVRFKEEFHNIVEEAAI